MGEKRVDCLLMRTPAPAASQGTAEGAHQVDQAHGFPAPSGMMPCSDMHWQRGLSKQTGVPRTALGIDDEVGGWWLRRLRRAVCGLSSGVAEHLWPAYLRAAGPRETRARLWPDGAAAASSRLARRCQCGNRNPERGQPRSRP
jgi:hypothetical protein